MVEGLRRLVHMRYDRCELAHEPLEIRMLGNDGVHLVETTSSAPIPQNVECRKCRVVVVGNLAILEQATWLDHFNSTIRCSREDVDAGPQLGQLEGLWALWRSRQQACSHHLGVHEYLRVHPQPGMTAVGEGLLPGPP